MCGILFIAQRDPRRIDAQRARAALERQRWRGPDATGLQSLDDGRVHLGHNRLAIIDTAHSADQPMRSACGRYTIVFNGEIYNHRALQRRFGLDGSIRSDTRTLLEGYAAHGEAFLEALEGMYAFVIHDSASRSWIAARDALGIKPLHLAQRGDDVVIASEPAVVAWLVDASIDARSLAEWRLIRRPVPGASFFTGVDELLPGQLLRSDGTRRQLWHLAQRNERFELDAFEALLQEVVHEHELSDVRNTALLSGGIDSTLILAMSEVPQVYSVGLPQSNEFDDAQDTADRLGRSMRRVTLQADALPARWGELARLRGEPLSVPNEALIHAACAAMDHDEKVVLTGEGADELMFGYDGVFRWAQRTEKFDAAEFYRHYGYSDSIAPTQRLADYLDELRFGKSTLEWVEDFFYRAHLPGLLRRMDFASMAASKEARVPFADRRLVDYCYRANPLAKLDERESKIPLRRMLERRGLTGPLNRRKIGFSARVDPNQSRQAEYRRFQDHVLQELSWS